MAGTAVTTAVYDIGVQGAMLLPTEDAKLKLSDAEDDRVAGVIIENDVIRVSLALRLILLAAAAGEMLSPTYRLELGCALTLNRDEMERSGN